jgi:phage baseplate assembly protein W
MRGEWPHFPEIGSKIYLQLFEPLDAVTADAIKTATLQAIAICEPRVLALRVDVRPDYNHDAYEITIYYQLVNSTDVHTVTELLRRIR